MKILLVEDDYMQSDALRSQLLKSFVAEIIIINTESDFIDYIPSIEKNPPDIIIIDIMLMWAKPSPNIPTQPEEYLLEGTSNAGFRCQQKLSCNPSTQDLPVILFSILEKYDLGEKLKKIPKNVIHVPKTSDFSALITGIKEIINKNI